MASEFLSGALAINYKITFICMMNTLSDEDSEPAIMYSHPSLPCMSIVATSDHVLAPLNIGVILGGPEAPPPPLFFILLL